MLSGQRLLGHPARVGHLGVRRVCDRRVFAQDDILRGRHPVPVASPVALVAEEAGEAGASTEEKES
mgnify:CR=1 FL=1